MYKWAEDNNIAYNGKKFRKITYGKKPIQGTHIQEDENVKDLGIYMSENIRFDFHINTIIKAAQIMSA